MSDSTSPPLILSLFGPFTASVNGSPLPRLRTRKGQWLLALLVLRSGAELERTWIAGTLWPDSDESRALHSLRSSLTDLRRVMGVAARRLCSPTPYTLSLDLSGAEIDVVTFDAAIARGDLAALEEAVLLYRGPLLEECAEAWVLQERLAREQAYLQALERLVEAALARGDPSGAECHLRRIIAVDPLRESAQRALMQVLATGGNYAAAIRTYRELRLLLRRELNANPDAETQALFQQLRAEAEGKAVGSRGREGPTPRISGGQVLLSAAELVRGTPPAEASLQGPGEHYFRGLARPEHVYQLRHPDLPAGFSPLQPLEVRRNNLPAPLTPLIGRQREVGMLRELLQRESMRLLTLIGPGGSGKTRLAVQVATDLLDENPEGVFFVDLAPITDPGLVTATIAQALEVPETGGQPPLPILKGYLRNKQLLLLLDNFEQVLAAAPVVTDLLVAAPHVKALVTSRAPLNLQGEHAFPVPPLALPDPQCLPPVEALAQCAAVQLFVQRASAVRPDFALTDKTAPAVAAICRRLDGLPLAIELAAARVRFLSPQALLSRLEHRLSLLTGGARDLPARQQTLRNAIAWSHDLLEVGVQALFRRLAVFVGGCTLEAVEAVCNAEGDLSIELLDGIDALVEISLVEQRGPWEGEPRLVLLETIREFASERLVESGEAAALRRAHAHFYVALVEEKSRAAPRLPADRSPGEPSEVDLDNVRAALDWIVETQDAALGLRLGSVLLVYWIRSGYTVELRRRLAAILLLPGALAPTAARAAVLLAAGGLAQWAGDYAAAQPLYEEYLAIQESLGDKADLGNAYEWLALVARNQGDYERAHLYCDQAMRIAVEREDRVSQACALYGMGYVAYLQEEYEKAQALLQQGLAMLHRESEEKYHIGWILLHLGEVADARGDYEGAYPPLFESLAIWRELDLQEGIACTLHEMGRVAQHQVDISKAKACFTESLRIFQVDAHRGRIFAAQCLEGLAGVIQQQGGLVRAARLLGAAARVRKASSAALSPRNRADLEQFLTAVRTELGETGFATAWAEGQSMLLEQAIEYGLEEPSG